MSSDMRSSEVGVKAVSAKMVFQPRATSKAIFEVKTFANQHFKHTFVPKQKAHGSSPFGLVPDAPSPLTSKVKTIPKRDVSDEKSVSETSLATSTSQAAASSQETREAESNRQIEKVFDKAAESLTRITGRSVTRTDIIFIFFEMIQLMIEHDGQEKIGRRLTRKEFIKRINEVADNLKDQSSWLLRTAIPGFFFDLATGVIPIVGHMKGEGILKFLSSYFTSLRGFKAPEFFKNLAKMANAFSKVQEAIANIHNRNADGKRTHDQSIADMSKVDEEECTHTARQLLQWISELIQAFIQAWQQRYDTESRFSSH